MTHVDHPCASIVPSHPYLYFLTYTFSLLHSQRYSLSLNLTYTLSLILSYTLSLSHTLLLLSYILPPLLYPSSSPISFPLSYILSPLLYPPSSPISSPLSYILPPLLHPSSSPISFHLSYILPPLLYSFPSPIFFPLSYILSPILYMIYIQGRHDLQYRRNQRAHKHRCCQAGMFDTVYSVYSVYTRTIHDNTITR